MNDRLVLIGFYIHNGAILHFVSYFLKGAINMADPAPAAAPKPADKPAPKPTLLAKMGKWAMIAIAIMFGLVLLSAFASSLMPMVINSITGLFGTLFNGIATIVNMLISFGKMLFKLLIGPAVICGVVYLIYDSFKKKPPAGP